MPMPPPPALSPAFAPGLWPAEAGDLADVVMNDPLLLVLGLLVWLPIAFWVVVLVQNLISGDLEFHHCLIGVCLSIALGAITMKPPHPALTIYLFLLVILLTVFFPTGQEILRQRQRSQMAAEEVEELYVTIDAYPLNWLARFELAKRLWSMGHGAQAIALGETSIVHMPGMLYDTEHNTLKRWKARFRPEGAPTGTRCLDCGRLNSLDAIRCESCNAPILLHLIRGRWVGRGAGIRLFWSWATLLLILVGVPYAALALPGRFAALGVIFLLLVALISVITIVLGGRKQLRS